MSKDGKSLEQLVKKIEELLLPEGFTVTANDRVYNDEGIQIAEFDVEVRGRLGSANIAWLIECRDRPSAGAAPGSWIEQLAGRKQRFGFNKVTAVSTTGFSAGVPEAADKLGIELRTVEELSAEDIAAWMPMKEMRQHIRSAHLSSVRFMISEDESPERIEALRRVLGAQSGDPKILKSALTGQLSTPAQAFVAAASGQGDPFEGLDEGGPPKHLEFVADYSSDSDHFVIETDLGGIRIRQIYFGGDLRLKGLAIPLAQVSEYRSNEAGVISQTASFPLEINKVQFAVEFHRMGSTGETHVMLRNLGPIDSIRRDEG